MGYRVVTAVLALLLAPSIGRAQDVSSPSGAPPAGPAAPRNLEVGIAAGGVMSMSPELGVRPIHWIASARYQVSPHFAIEPEIGRWSYERDYGWPPATGGFAQSIDWTSAGANLLGQFPIGKAAVFAGGGAGWYFYHRRDRATAPGSDWTYEWSHSGLGLQVVAGVDIRVAPRVVFFAAVRGQVVPEAELTTRSLLAGVRYAF